MSPRARRNPGCPYVVMSRGAEHRVEGMRVLTNEFEVNLRSSRLAKADAWGLCEEPQEAVGWEHYIGEAGAQENRGDGGMGHL